MQQFMKEESIRLEEEESLEVFDGSVVDVRYLGDGRWGTLSSM